MVGSRQRRILVAALLVAAYFLLPQVVADWYYELFPLTAGVLLLRAANRQRSGVLVLFGVGLLLQASGDSVWTYAERVLRDDIGVPSAADVLYLSGYLAFIAGVVLLARRRMPGVDRGGLLDAAVIAVSFALFLWVYVMAPYVGDHALSVAGRAVALAYPTVDLLLLAVVARLAFGGVSRRTSDRVLVGVLVAQVAADAIYAVLAVQGRYSSGMWLDGLFLAAYAGWAIFALEQEDTLRVVVPARARLSNRRLVLLATASLVAPGVLAVQALVGGSLQLPAVIGGCAVLFLLVTARMAELVREMHVEATHDPLTGLPNRALLEQHLEQLLRRRDEVGVLFLDLDRFKLVNDTLGHAAGDELLRSVAQRMQTELRQGDMVARYAGDEFVVVLGDPADAVACATRLSRVLAEPVHIAGTPVHPSASIGIATSAARDHADAEMLLRDADLAMFSAKSKVDARFVVFDEAMREGAGRLRIEASLRASELDRFEVHYQPIVDLDSGAIVGFEALVRWRDDDGSLLLPEAFHHIAEDTGLIVDIGGSVLKRACRFAAAHGGVDIYVNLSPRELAFGGLRALVADALRHSGLEPARLHLEISEKALDGSRPLPVLADLAALGVRIDLDDLGAGTSALPQLRLQHFHSLKLDRSLVHGIAGATRERAIVHGIATIAADLGVELVAEGVERQADLDELRALGCARAQGFLLSPARPAEDWLMVPADSGSVGRPDYLSRP